MRLITYNPLNAKSPSNDGLSLGVSLYRMIAMSLQGSGPRLLHGRVQQRFRTRGNKHFLQFLCVLCPIRAWTQPFLDALARRLNTHLNVICQLPSV